MRKSACLCCASAGRRAPSAPCSRSTTTSTPATATRSACCSRSSNSPTSSSSWTSCKARRARRSSWRRIRTAAFRRCELDDGTFLAESDAILWYLAEGTPFIPADRLARAQVLQWMFFEQYSHEPYVATHALHHAPPAGGFAAPRGDARSDEARRRRARGDGEASGDAALLRRASATRSRTSRCTRTRTCADRGRSISAPYPNVLAWLGRVKDQPKHMPITYRPASRRVTVLRPSRRRSRASRSLPARLARARGRPSSGPRSRWRSRRSPAARSCRISCANSRPFMCGHRHVGQHEIELAGRRPEGLERFLAAGEAGHLMTQVLSMRVIRKTSGCSSSR